jgi:uncharacterized BrkB/YihY/UPF0761 family membrane protein
MSLRQVWRLLKETFSEWQSNEVSLLASSLAYYTVFSLAPLMVMIVQNESQQSQQPHSDRQNHQRRQKRFR